MGTRGGRPEPQAVAARTAGKNAQRGQSGKSRAGNGRPGSARTAGAGNGVATRPAAGNAAARAVPAKAVPAEQAGPPRWFQRATLVLAVAGLGVAIYLTYAHFTEAAVLACPDTGAVNCAKVTTSPESMVFGIPVAVLGLAFFLFMVAVTTPWAWRARPRAGGPPAKAARLASLGVTAIPWARLISVIIGIVFVLYLIYAELFLVNAICLWCTAVHVLTFLLFCLIVGSAAIWGLNRPAAGSQ